MAPDRIKKIKSKAKRDRERIASLEQTVQSLTQTVLQLVQQNATPGAASSAPAASPTATPPATGSTLRTCERCFGNGEDCAWPAGNARQTRCNGCAAKKIKCQSIPAEFRPFAAGALNLSGDNKTRAIRDVMRNIRASRQADNRASAQASASAAVPAASTVATTFAAPTVLRRLRRRGGCGTTRSSKSPSPKMEEQARLR